MFMKPLIRKEIPSKFYGDTYDVVLSIILGIVTVMVILVMYEYKITYLGYPPIMALMDTCTSSAIGFMNHLRRLHSPHIVKNIDLKLEEIE